MNILIIGTGGREHAICRTLKKSQTETKIYAANGNPGIAQVAECVRLDINNFNEVIEFCYNKKITFVVIGPEQPIADGMSDALRNANIKVFAPSKYAAQLESSKSFAKDFMIKYNIPTAKYATFSKNKSQEAFNYIDTMDVPVVIKADGLAAGKGVVIAENKEEAKNVVSEFLDGLIGEASEKIVIEEFMQGEEASIFAITDGTDFVILNPAQDHKRIGNNDTGKNTGGMGAYSPISLITESMLDKIKEKIIYPTIEGMKKEGYPYVGCLYVGLMINENEPKVVEFNCRFGDPETQSVLSLYEGDFAKLLYSAAAGKLDKNAFTNNIYTNDKIAVTLILASAGYPDKFEKGIEIRGDAMHDSDDIIVYHSGTKIENGKLLTNGGRVLGITAIANNIKSAIDKAYNFSESINFKNKYMRDDIGKKELMKHN